MSDSFDPYYTWLGIPPDEQPPNHYRLLGVREFEDHADVIANAADRQMTHVRTFQSGKNSKHSQRILNEISKAKVCLLSPDKKQEYDDELRAAEARTSRPPSKPAAAAPLKRAAKIKRPEPAFNFEPASPLRAARPRSSSQSKMLVPLIAAGAVGLVLIAVIVAIVLGRGDAVDDPKRVGGTDAGAVALGTTGSDGGHTDAETDGGSTSGPATTGGNSTDRGATDGGATDTDGGSTDSNFTDGGSTGGGGSDGDAIQPPAPAPVPLPANPPRADGWIDLLARVAPAKDAISGNWTRDGPLLRCTGASSEFCAMPYEPKGAYELELDVRRLTPSGVIQIHLPVGSAAVTLGLHGKRSDGLFVAGLAVSGGTSPGTATTVVDPPAADVVHRVRVKVTPQDANATITADMDGRQIASWTGPQSSLSSRLKDLPNPKQIVVGAYSAAVEFQGIRLLDKSAPPVLPTPSGAAGNLQVAWRSTLGDRDYEAPICFSPTGHYLVARWRDETQIWDLAKAKMIGSFSAADWRWPTCVAISPDGKTIATGDYGCAVRLWDAATGEEMKTLGKQSRPLASVAFTSNGEKLVSASWWDIVIWDVQAQTELRRFDVPKQDSIMQAVLSLDGETLITGTSTWQDTAPLAAKVIAYDLNTGKQKWSVPLGVFAVHALALSPDGGLLAVGTETDRKINDEDHHIQLLRAANGDRLGAISVGKLPTLAVSFSLDGHTLATGHGTIFGAAEGAAKLFDVARRTEIATFEQVRYNVRGVAYSTDGKTIATSARSLKLWDVHSTAAINPPSSTSPPPSPPPAEGAVRIEAEAMQPVGGQSEVEGDFVRLMQLRSARQYSFEAPQAGTYTFRVRAYGQQLGDEPAKMSFIVDDKLLFACDVGAVADRPAVYNLNVNGLPRGRHTIRIQFANDIYISPTRDRDLLIDYLEIVPPAGVSIVGTNAAPAPSIDAPPAKREAVPERAAQEETLKRVQELFKAEYAAAKTDAAKVELAQTLAKTSGDSKAPAVERYVLLSEASRLAVEGARADVAIVIIDAIGRGFETDTFQLKADALNESLKHMRLDDQRKQLADLAWTASGAALDAKQFEACESLLKTVLSCVARPRDDEAREMRKEATLRLLELQKLKQQAADADQG